MPPTRPGLTSGVVVVGGRAVAVPMTLGRAAGLAARSDPHASAVLHTGGVKPSCSRQEPPRETSCVRRASAASDREPKTKGSNGTILHTLRDDRCAESGIGFCRCETPCRSIKVPQRGDDQAGHEASSLFYNPACEFVIESSISRTLSQSYVYFKTKELVRGMSDDQTVINRTFISTHHTRWLNSG